MLVGHEARVGWRCSIQINRRKGPQWNTRSGKRHTLAVAAVRASDVPELLASAARYRGERVSSHVVQHDADPDADNRIQETERRSKTDVGTSAAANRKT